jgi:5-methylcytosine-specific restriction endonuclease McrA
MKSKPKQDRAWLLATARAVAERLQGRGEGTHLRIRLPSRAFRTNTDGWRTVIGSLGRGQPRLEVWLDRFAGYPQRKLWACFRANARPQITAITKRVDRKLGTARIVTSSDTDEDQFFVLAKRLTRSEFSTPILEKYSDGLTFYGIYDPTRETAARVSPHFCARASAFFEDVVRALPHAKADDEQRDVYPRLENRRWVASHLKRERSTLLAAECKIRDGYQCQVCSLRFAAAYGRLGHEFAEAHHIIPLGKLRDGVKTRLEDLVTVCANCHRMLHRMEGSTGDIRKLKTIVRKHRP